MAVYSTNQNRQFYVATGAGTVDATTTTVGTIKPKITKEGELFFLYKGAADGAEGLQASDRIPLKNLDYVKAVAATDMATSMRKISISLGNSGVPVVGENYVLRIAFKQFHGMSDEHQYFKDAVVRATSAMSTAKDLFDEMVNALNLAFSREVGATKTSNPYLAFSVSGSGASAKLVIEEKEQPWVVGIGKFERVLFDIIPTTINNNGVEEIWAAQNTTTKEYYTVETSTTTVGNGKEIADIEWFCMGERGDQYRMMGYPNYIPTTYQVDPSKTYDVLEFHFAFTDTGVNSYRSEKDITIVADSTSHTVINAVIGAINAAYATYTGVEGSTLVEELS